MVAAVLSLFSGLFCTVAAVVHSDPRIITQNEADTLYYTWITPAWVPALLFGICAALHFHLFIKTVCICCCCGASSPKSLASRFKVDDNADADAVEVKPGGAFSALLDCFGLFTFIKQGAMSVHKLYVETFGDRSAFGVYGEFFFLRLATNEVRFGQSEI